MTPNIIRHCVTAAAITLCSCQSAPPQGLRFDTRITSDGYKLFQLAFPQPAHTVRLGGRRETQSREAQGYSEKRLKSALEEILEQNRYCREGYVVLGRYAGETSNRMRGECREKASEEDLRLYPNTLQSW